MKYSKTNDNKWSQNIWLVRNEPPNRSVGSAIRSALLFPVKVGRVRSGGRGQAAGSGQWAAGGRRQVGGWRAEGRGQQVGRAGRAADYTPKEFPG